jgi:hypothetical protein
MTVDSRQASQNSSWLRKNSPFQAASSNEKGDHSKADPQLEARMEDFYECIHLQRINVKPLAIRTQ